MGYNDTRHWLYQFFKVGTGGRYGLYFDYFVIVLIILNVLAVMLETVETFYIPFQWEFLVFEALSVAIFTVEYLGRLWSATEHPEYQHPVRGRLRYAVSPYMIIDLLAILPFYG